MIQMKDEGSSTKGEIFHLNLNPLVFCPSTAMQSHYLLFNQQLIQQPS